MSIRVDRLVIASAIFLCAIIPATAAGGRCGEAYAQVVWLRAAADFAAKHGDQRVANERLDEALDALGSRYDTKEIIDDTGMKLILARQAEAKRHLKQAALIKRKVLSNRLQLCTMASRL